jgi:centromeric protein E
LGVLQQGVDSPKTPIRRKKGVPLTPPSSNSRQCPPADTRSPAGARRSLRYENNENTPPRVLRESIPSAHGGENVSPHVNGPQKSAASPAKSGEISSSQCSKESPGGAHKRSNSVDIRKMQNMFKTAAEENIKSIRAYVTELKERVAKLQYQKQLLVCQVLKSISPVRLPFATCNSISSI